MTYQLMQKGYELIQMLTQMANNIYTIFNTPLKDIQDTIEFPGLLNEVIDLILNTLAIGEYSLLTLMFGSGIIIVLLFVHKNFFVS